MASVRGADALVAAKAASVETAPATDGSASAPAETTVVPEGKFAVLKPGGRAAAFADADGAPAQDPSAQRLRGHQLPLRGARQRLVMMGLQRQRPTWR